MKPKIKQHRKGQAALEWLVKQHNYKKADPSKEFAALMKEMEGFGFRPADVARMLNKSQGAISQYLSGYTKPSETVLALLRRIVVEKQGGKTLSETEEVAWKLACLKEADHATYLLLKNYIEKFYERAAPVLAVMPSIGPKSKDNNRDATEHLISERSPSEKKPLKVRAVRSKIKPSTES